LKSLRTREIISEIKIKLREKGTVKEDEKEVKPVSEMRFHLEEIEKMPKVENIVSEAEENETK
ncbi:MAG: hypothetical protein AB1546_05315, partial [bacterium]